MDYYSQFFDMVGTLARRRYTLAEQQLGALAITHTEARLLTLLSENGGCCPQDTLAARVVIDRSNVGRSLKRLEQQAYVTRSKDSNDRRSYIVSLTDQGRTVQKQVAEVRENIIAQFCQTLSKQDAKTLVDILHKSYPE